MRTPEYEVTNEFSQRSLNQPLMLWHSLGARSYKALNVLFGRPSQPQLLADRAGQPMNLEQPVRRRYLPTTLGYDNVFPIQPELVVEWRRHRKLFSVSAVLA
jgi:hypothetical protein